MTSKIPSTAISIIKSREPIRIKANIQLVDVVTAMKEERRGAAIVEDDAGKIIGIITERDLIAGVDHNSLGWHLKPVSEVMNKKPKTIKESQFVHEALDSPGRRACARWASPHSGSGYRSRTSRARS